MKESSTVKNILLLVLVILPMEPVHSRAISPPVPRGNIESWVTEADYPSAARKEGRTGTTYYRATITPAGRVSDCKILHSSGYKDLDLVACSQVRRIARFIPALDKENNPQEGYFDWKVEWSNLTQSRRLTNDEWMALIEKTLNAEKNKE